MATYRAGGFSLTRWFQPCAIRLFVGLFHFVDRRPRLMRLVWSVLRVRPVWRIGQTVLVTADRQVLDALTRDDDFPLPEKRAAKFLAGPFVLGMTRTPQFSVERAEIEAVVLERDRDRVRQLSLEVSQDAIVARAAVGQLDVVSDLSTPVGMSLVRDYFGVTPTRQLSDDLRILGAMVASPDSELDAFKQRAEAAACRVFRAIEPDIDEAERWAGRKLDAHEPLPDHATVLQRLVFRSLAGLSRLDREGIRRNITGVLLPGSALVTRAFATSLVQLFEKEKFRKGAVKAANDGSLDVLESYLLEALRFHPVFPVMPRFCPHETVLSGFRREYKLKPGRDVFVAVGSAMFDPGSPLFSAVARANPSKAHLRSRNDYRHFGGGIHECPGRHLALAQMSAMLSVLLPLPGFKCGSIAYNDDGLTPRTLQVEFQAVTIDVPEFVALT